MMQKNAFGQYKESSVYTASPEELTLMLYNGLVRFVIQAQMAIEGKDFEKANSSIVKAENIIREFQCTLDMKYEISQSLLALYDFMYWHLIDANMKKDKEILEEVLFIAKELRDTWTQAMKVAKQQRVRQVAR